MIRPDLNYEYICFSYDLERVINWLENRSYFCIDTETSSLSPFTGKVILLQVGNLEKQWLIDTRAVNIEPLRPFLVGSDKLKLGHHIKFDHKMLKTNFNMEMSKIACTGITEQIIRAGLYPKHGLEDLTKHYLGFDIDKDENLPALFPKFLVTYQGPI